MITSPMRITFLLMLAFTSQVCVAQSWAAKMFAQTEHNFGAVSRNAKAEFDFEIENIYEEDLHIASVRSSCGCTSAKILTPTLKTWEKGAIRATFNTQSFIGPKSAAITVVIDRPYYAELQLLVTGRVRSDIVTEPGQVDFGNVKPGEVKNQTIKIAYAGRSDWTIKDVRGNNEHLQVRIRNVERKGNLTNYSLELRLLETAPAGPIQDELVIVTDDRVNDRFTMPVSGKVDSPLTITPDLVDLGQVPADGEANQRFIVKGTEPFSIKQIKTSDKRLKFAHDEAKKLIHIVTVSAARNDTSSASIASDIEIISDLPGANTAVCKIVGQID
jgi:hypothetical protein